MHRIALLLMLYIVGLGFCEAQIFDMLDRDIYRGRVKLVSEFMKRFNREKFSPNIDTTSNEAAKLNLCQLFDSEFILSNRSVNEPRAFQFIDSVLNNDIRIEFKDPEWYARVNCIGQFKGKEVSFDILLTVAYRGEGRYKWVITDVDGDLFHLSPSDTTNERFILPNENESNFMHLNTLTSGAESNITLFSAETATFSRLMVFNTLVYYGFLKIDYVDNVEFCFLQVPGFIFTINEIERESTNSGWLITRLVEMSEEEKDLYLQGLYNNSYDYAEMRMKTIPDPPKPPKSSSKNAEVAVDKVKTFIAGLNKFIDGDSTLDQRNQLEDMVKGRYKFIISDEISKKLAEIQGLKNEDSYRFDQFLQMMAHKDNPIEKFIVSDFSLLPSDIAKPEYGEDFIKVKTYLATKGELCIEEEVVFFLYKNQIAGIKLLKDCVVE